MLYPSPNLFQCLLLTGLCTPSLQVCVATAEHHEQGTMGSLVVEQAEHTNSVRIVLGSMALWEQTEGHAH